MSYDREWDDQGRLTQEAEDKERELARQEVEREAFWAAVLSTLPGRREMWRILQDSHFDSDQFGSDPGGHHTWLLRGEQAFGYRLFLTLLRYDRNGTLLMLEEHDHRLAKPPHGEAG